MTVEQNTTTDSAAKNKQKRQRLLINLTAFFLLLGLIYLLYWLFIGQFYESTDDAYVGGNLVQVMPQISGKVTEILADETDLVAKGEPLITLDKTDAAIALRNAEAQLAINARQVSQLYQDVARAQANVSLKQKNLEKTQQDLERRQGLVVNKTISSEDFQHAQIEAASAKYALELAKNQLASAEALVANTELYHHPVILQAEVRLRNAYLTLQRTSIYAPESGYVAKRAVEVGQQINPNRILMIIVPLNQVWINANFKESQLKHIRIGQPVQIISDIYGSAVKYQGTVVGLSPGTGSVFDLLPPQNATGNWIKIVQRLPVRITINPEQLKKYPLRIGLSVVVTIDTRNRNGAILTPLAPRKVIYETKDFSTDLKQADEVIKKILQGSTKNLSYPASP